MAEVILWAKEVREDVQSHVDPLKTAPRAASYDSDFNEWTQAQGRALRNRRAADLDWENLAEEIESLGRSDQREVKSRLTTLLVHLLKWRYQPEKRSDSWADTIARERPPSSSSRAQALPVSLRRRSRGPTGWPDRRRRGKLGLPFVTSRSSRPFLCAMPSTLISGPTVRCRSHASV